MFFYIFNAYLFKNIAKFFFIEYFMNLTDVKIGAECIIKSVDIADHKNKIRLMELGLVNGAKVKVKNKSVFKHTLLIIFNMSSFTLKDNLAKEVQVEYV